ncbi:MAG: hypothetical protein ACP5GJ_03165 [Nanopusillaceae archaeon]|jgi:hypothetical protein
MNIFDILYIFSESFILNAFPLFGSPFTILSLPILIIEGINFQNMIIISIILGIGAATGKLFMYLLGILLSKPLRYNRNLIFIKKISKSKYFIILFFFFTILPFFPIDDLFFLSFGIEKTGIIKYYVTTIIGKIIKSFAEIYIEIYLLKKISYIININLFYLSIYSSILFLILSIIFFKVDWEKYINRWLLKKKSGL